MIQRASSAFLPLSIRVSARLACSCIAADGNRENLLFKTATSILVILNYNSSRVLFDKIAYVYFFFKNILCFSTGNVPSVL